MQVRYHKESATLMDGPGLTVWVSGYARSATSTVLSMVKAATLPGAEDSEWGGRKRAFSIFEPCHDGDQLSAALQAGGCGALLQQISNCNFEGVEWLHGFEDKHSTPMSRSNYTPSAASAACKEADFIATKTVDFGHRIEEVLNLLDQNPSLRLLDVVRDPRGIWASWKSTYPLWSLLETKQFRHLMTDACESFASNLDAYHPQVHRIVFEDLMSDPHTTMENVYKFLNLPFGEAQTNWIQSTFDSKNCTKDADQYADCRSNHTVAVQRWHSVLNETERKTFLENSDCQVVANMYGYEL
jgi:hypothetical protein